MKLKSHRRDKYRNHLCFCGSGHKFKNCCYTMTAPKSDRKEPERIEVEDIMIGTDGWIGT